MAAYYIMWALWYAEVKYYKDYRIILPPLFLLEVSYLDAHQAGTWIVSCERRTVTNSCLACSQYIEQAFIGVMRPQTTN